MPAASPSAAIAPVPVFECAVENSLFPSTSVTPAKGICGQQIEHKIIFDGQRRIDGTADGIPGWRPL